MLVPRAACRTRRELSDATGRFAPVARNHVLASTIGDCHGRQHRESLQPAASARSRSSATGWVLGVIIALAVIAVLWYYGTRDVAGRGNITNNTTNNTRDDRATRRPRPPSRTHRRLTPTELPRHRATGTGTTPAPRPPPAPAPAPHRRLLRRTGSCASTLPTPDGRHCTRSARAGSIPPGLFFVMGVSQPSG